VSLAFGNPALLWGLAAALVPLAIHLFFRRRPRPTPFPALEFILRAKRENQRRVKLRRVLLFSARTLLLLAAALALTRPRLERATQAAAALPRGPAATALVLDASASMRYRPGGETLFERARADLGDALAALSGEEPATLVVCDGPGADAAVPSFEREPLRRALAGAAPSFGHADLGACVAAAAQALSAEALAGFGKRIVVATDLAASAWRLDAPAPLVSGPGGPSRPEVKLLDAARGAALPNLALVDLTAAPDLGAGPRGVRLTATVASHGREDAARAVPLEVRLGAGPAQQVAIRGSVDVPAGGTARKVFTYSFPEAAAAPAGPGDGRPAAARPSGELTVALPADPLPVDDARSVVVPVPRDARALVVNGDPSPRKLDDEAFFVEAALASPASPARPTLVDADSLSRVRLADFGVVFLLNVRGLGAAKADELRRFVEEGGGLFVAVGDAVDPDVYARELGPLLPALHVVKTVAPARGEPGAQAARFDAVDFTHPALAVFTGEAQEGLVGARTARYLLVKPDRARQDRVLASYDDGAPALVESRAGLGRVVLFTSTADRAWSDWAIRTSFLPAVQRFAAYLAGALERPPAPPTVVGAPRRLEPGEGARLVAVVAPDGSERRAEALPPSAGPGSPRVIVPDRPGPWGVRVERGGQVQLDPALAFAAVPDARESDTRRVDAAELTAWFGGAEHAAVAADARPERALPLWSILLVVALAAFFLEGVLVS
jgi:hypothetical protein